MKQPIAYAVYISDGGDLFAKELFTLEEIQKVRDSEDECVEYQKCKIVLKDGFTIEDHT